MTQLFRLLRKVWVWDQVVVEDIEAMGKYKGLDQQAESGRRLSGAEYLHSVQGLGCFSVGQAVGVGVRKACWGPLLRGFRS